MMSETSKKNENLIKLKEQKEILEEQGKISQKIKVVKLS